ncbi:MAG: hypothetical protein HKN47_23980, partial [Pirellulaceae bacterium]|nr:hypothetical protein [Pirellulaceae bacterium]
MEDKSTPSLLDEIRQLQAKISDTQCDTHQLGFHDVGETLSDDHQQRTDQLRSILQDVAHSHECENEVGDAQDCIVHNVEAETGSNRKLVVLEAVVSELYEPSTRIAAPID